jgi:hypothetical protein
MNFFDDSAVRHPTIEQHDGVDILRFHSEWQIKLMLERWFVSFIVKYVENSEQFRLVLCLESVRGLTRKDLGNVCAVFMPLIMYGGIVCLCDLHPEIDHSTRNDLLDSGFLVASDLTAAIQAVRDAEMEV